MEELRDMELGDLPAFMEMLTKNGVKPLHICRLERSLRSLKTVHPGIDIGVVSNDSDTSSIHSSMPDSGGVQPFAPSSLNTMMEVPSMPPPPQQGQWPVESRSRGHSFSESLSMSMSGEDDYRMDGLFMEQRDLLQSPGIPTSKSKRAPSKGKTDSTEKREKGREYVRQHRKRKKEHEEKLAQHTDVLRKDNQALSTQIQLEKEGQVVPGSEQEKELQNLIDERIANLRKLLEASTQETEQQFRQILLHLFDKDVVVTHSEIGYIYGSKDCCDFFCKMFTSVPNFNVDVTLMEPERESMGGPHCGIRAEVLFTGIHSTPVDFLSGIAPTGCPIKLPITCRFRYAGHRIVQVQIAPKIGPLLTQVASILEARVRASQTSQMASRKNAMEELVLAINAFSTSEKGTVFPPKALFQEQGREGGNSFEQATDYNSSMDPTKTHFDGTTVLRCGNCRSLLAWANLYLTEDCIIGDEQTVPQNWYDFCKDKGQTKILLEIGTNDKKLAPLVGPAGLVQFILERWGRFFDFNLEQKSMDLGMGSGDCSLDFVVEGKCQMPVGALLYGVPIKRDNIRLNSKIVFKFQKPKPSLDEIFQNKRQKQDHGIISTTSCAASKDDPLGGRRAEKIVRMEFKWNPFAVFQQVNQRRMSHYLPSSSQRPSTIPPPLLKCSSFFILSPPCAFETFRYALGFRAILSWVALLFQLVFTNANPIFAFPSFFVPIWWCHFGAVLSVELAPPPAANFPFAPP
jgi:hypothetical protein